MKRAFIRWFYLGGLLSFFTWIISSTTGGWAYMRSEGLVVGDPAAVASEYTVVVKEVKVREGQEVKAGEVIAVVASTRVAEVQARLTVSASALTGQLAQTNTRIQMLNSLLASAQLRERVATEGASQVTSSTYTPVLVRTAATDQMFKGKQDLATLQAERQALTQQITTLVEASRQTDAALLDLVNTFDMGNMRCPIDGTVSVVKVGPGSVAREGEPLVEIVGTHRFILAFFPIDRLYRLAVGDKVKVDAGGIIGNGTLTGSIAKISNIAGALPKEFQKTLSPVDRQQLVRIEFDPNQTLPPYFSKVVIR